jgi:hypothetical protein
MERLILIDGYVWFQSEYFLIFIFILHCRLSWSLCSTLQNVDMAQPCLVPPYRPRVRPPLKHHIMPTLASHQEIRRHAHRMETPTARIKSRRAYPLPLIQINLSLGSCRRGPSNLQESSHHVVAYIKSIQVIKSVVLLCHKGDIVTPSMCAGELWSAAAHIVLCC